MWDDTYRPNFTPQCGFSYLILLPPSLLVGVVLVVKSRSQLIKKSLISIASALILWWVSSMVMVLIIWLCRIPSDRAKNCLHLLNPVLFAVLLLLSGIFVFKVFARREKKRTNYNEEVRKMGIQDVLKKWNKESTEEIYWELVVAGAGEEVASRVVNDEDLLDKYFQLRHQLSQEGLDNKSIKLKIAFEMRELANKQK